MQFIVPALFTRGDLTLAVSTGGSSPALARKIRHDLGEYFGAQYGAFLTLRGGCRHWSSGLATARTTTPSCFGPLWNPRFSKP
jgi:precorrin-2 dehydrogenase/sirohydrochlorin ferrochelatase